MTNLTKMADEKQTNGHLPPSTAAAVAAKEPGTSTAAAAALETQQQASSNNNTTTTQATGVSVKPSPPVSRTNSFWYLDNPSHRKRKVYSGPYEGKKILLIMVGLPARSKTYLARKTARYLNWLGFSAEVFNCSDYGRKHAEETGLKEKRDGFLHDSQEATQAAQTDLWSWLENSGQIGIYDGNNVTKAEREAVSKEAIQRKYQVVFVETICNEPSIVAANIREAKFNSPEYANVDEEVVEKEFRDRIAHLESIYETIDDDSLSYIKIIQHDHYDRKVITNRIKGYLIGRIAFFLSNVHIAPRHIFLSRHGESQDNVLGRIGGDSSLSERGKVYAKKLAEFIMAGKPENSEFKIWTSTLNRSIETSQHFHLPTVQWKVLNEIHAGICEGMTYKQIEEQFPEEFVARANDKFHYRYPQGESYADLVQRLEPVIIELERQYDPVLVIGHQAVLRVLYAYFSGKEAKECPHLDVPLHTVAQLTPRAYSCEEQHFKLC